MHSREIASSLYRECKLTEAIEAQMEWLRSNPSDMGARLFLFELLAFDGQWERAQRQALALQTNDAESDAAVGLYQKCLLSEGKRDLAYQGLAQPRVLGPLTDSLKIRLEAFHAELEIQDRLIHQAIELEITRENPAMVSTLFNCLKPKRPRFREILSGFQPDLRQPQNQVTSSCP